MSLLGSMAFFDKCSRIAIGLGLGLLITIRGQVDQILIFRYNLSRTTNAEGDQGGL